MYYDRKTVAVAILCWRRIMKKRRENRKKRLWVHPIVSARHLKGAFVTLYSSLREDEKKFFNYFRMSIKSFDELHHKLEEHLKFSNEIRVSISSVERLCVCLRYLASGNTFTDMHYTYRLGISTISGIVELVCDEIWTRMKEDCMPEPSQEKWHDIAFHFEKYANFPNCLGAVDGKHIRIVKPIKSGSLCFNYKHFFSLVLLAICDANYCFTYIDVGAFGKFSDSTIFVNSLFWNKLENHLLNIPEDKPISGYDETQAFPYVIVGDEAFRLTPHLLRPYARKNLTHKKKVFNYRLTRARRYIECSFGILSNKWRIFHRPLNVSFRLAKKIVKACCVLHNFVCIRDGYAFHHTLTVKGFSDIRPNLLEQNRAGYSVRDAFANYFISPVGQVPWQESKIH